MKTLLRWLLWAALLAVIATPFALFFSVLSPTPAVTSGEKPDTADITRLAQQHSADTGQGRREVRLNAHDLTLAIDYQIHRQKPVPPVAVGLALGDGKMNADITVALPLPISHHFLNLHAVLVPAGNTLKLTGLAAGALPLPRAVVGKVQRWLQAKRTTAPGQARLTDAITHLAIHDGALVINYRSDSDLAAALGAGPRTLLASRLDQQAVSLYATELGRLALASGGRIALHTALPELFAIATRRMASGQAPVDENRALLASLALYGADPKVLALAQLGDNAPNLPSAVHLTLHQRADLARHYVTSAVLALVAGTDMADIAGQYKEAAGDVDIAALVADRAGALLTQRATRDPQSARATAQKLASLGSDDQLMPAPSDPQLKAMMQQRINASSGQLGQANSNIRRQIEALLKGLPLYTNPE